VTSGRGLCGAFNTNQIRETLKYIAKYGSQNVDLMVVGRKGRDYFRRMGSPITKDYINLGNAVSFAQAELITADLLTAYTAGVRPHVNKGSGPSHLVAVDMLYNEFKSVIQQKLVVKTLLPLTPVENVETRAWPDFLYEPLKEKLLNEIVLRFLKSQVFRVLLESSAAELGARMAAMDNATRNAAELMSSLTLTMNRTRQSSITKEILEVVSGAEALK
jgi:F-type H+-transporting ATPase subunit gamma